VLHRPHHLRLALVLRTAAGHPSSVP
jgi:hypothetical protein